MFLFGPVLLNISYYGVEILEHNQYCLGIWKDMKALMLIQETVLNIPGHSMK